MKFISILHKAASAALLVMLISCSHLPLQYYQTLPRQHVTFEQIFESVKDKRVIFIGEAHDSKRDHAIQQELIRWLHDSGRSVSLALEMFTAESQELLDRWVSGELSEDRFYEEYRRQWEIPYELYRDIFLYARKHGVRLYGINADRELIRTVALQGTGMLPPGQLERIKFLPCVETPEYAKAIGLQSIHGAHGFQAGMLCDAQKVRDSMMAYRISETLEREPGTLVVLMGTAHAMREAVPMLLLRHMSDISCSVLLPSEIYMLTGQHAGKATADFIW